MKKIVQRYGKTADDTPLLEVVTWVEAGTEGFDADDPRAVPLDGEEGLWVWASGAGLFADVSPFISQAVIDDVTGVVLDQGGAVADPAGYGDVYVQALRPGITLITRGEYHALIQAQEEDH